MTKVNGAANAKHDWWIKTDMEYGMFNEIIDSTHNIELEYHVHNHRIYGIYAKDNDVRLHWQLAQYMGKTNDASIDEVMTHLSKKAGHATIIKYVIRSIEEWGDHEMTGMILGTARFGYNLEPYLREHFPQLSAGVRRAVGGSPFDDHGAVIRKWFAERENCAHWRGVFSDIIKSRKPGDVKEAFYGKRFFTPMINAYLRYRLERLFSVQAEARE